MSIGIYDFSDCPTLQSAILISGLTVLGERMFNGAKLLKEVTVPSTITSIGQ